MRLFLDLLFSTIGTGYFLYGKSQRIPSLLALGVFLFVYPYFVSNLALLIVIGVLASAFPLAQHKGWI